MKRILVINVNWLGDVLFSTPFLRTLREAHPDAFLASVVLPRCREVLRNNPRLDQIIEYDEQGIHRTLAGKLRFIANLRRLKFDTAFILHPSWKRALISVCAGIPQRIGYATKNRQRILTRAVPVPEEPLHKIDYFLRIAAACGMRVRSDTYEFFVSPAEEDQARQLLASRGVQSRAPYVVLNPGGNWEPKRWPTAHFSCLANFIHERSDCRVVVVGATKDMVLAQTIAASLRKPPVIIAGQTNLGQLAAIMKMSRVVVSADSGPLHIAAAVGATAIGLFGPTDPALTGPRGVGKTVVLHKPGDCLVPCYREDCSAYDCMRSLRPEEVWQAMAPFLHTPHADRETAARNSQQ